MNQETIQYVSSVDGTGPLFEDVAFIADGRRKPLVVVMHGYNGQRKAVAQDIHDLAGRGLFAVAPDMRGRGESAGRFDSGGLDVHDILDGILAVISRFPGDLDEGNINIMGYSGGGANTLAAATRFPDLFQVGGAFFGISDYGLWYQLNPGYRAAMDTAVGGSPHTNPLAYAARNACLAAGNNRMTRLHIFWDEEEKSCPPVMNERFLEAARAAGATNGVAHVSRVSDAVRWYHGYRTNWPVLAQADDILIRDITKPVPDLGLPHEGTLTVCGYLVCRHFQVFVEAGQRGVVTVRYDLSGNTPRVTVQDNPDNLKVTISLKTPLAVLRGCNQ